MHRYKGKRSNNAKSFYFNTYIYSKRNYVCEIAYLANFKIFAIIF